LHQDFSQHIVQRFFVIVQIITSYFQHIISRQNKNCTYPCRHFNSRNCVLWFLKTIFAPRAFNAYLGPESQLFDLAWIILFEQNGKDIRFSTKIRLQSPSGRRSLYREVLATNGRFSTLLGEISSRQGFQMSWLLSTFYYVQTISSSFQLDRFEHLFRFVLQHFKFDSEYNSRCGLHSGGK